MDAGRGSYLCGLVLGIAVGVAGTHVALSGRTKPRVRLPELSISSHIDTPAAPLEPSPLDGLAELRTALAPQPSTVHAIATAPAETGLSEPTPAEPASVAPPRPLLNVEGAAPLPAEMPREDDELRAFIRDELQTLAASEHDIWYETLRGMAREDATEILRIWKLTRGAGGAPMWPELKQQLASLPVEQPVSAPPSAAPVATTHPPQPQHTAASEIRRLYHLNLANAATPGFKLREVMIFEQPVGGHVDVPSSPSSAPGIWINTSQGKLTNTNRLLDCAVQGPGFFQVEREGQTFLTRCGRFILDDEGRLAVPRHGGAPCPLEPAITVPQDGERLQIQNTGEVTVVINDATQRLGSIHLFEVGDPAALEPVGDNLFGVTAASGAATPLPPEKRGLIVQGSIEESNVDPAAERRKVDALAITAPQL